MAPRAIKKSSTIGQKEPSVINPKHYALVVNGQPIQVVDIMEARFKDDMHLAQAFKYLMRAGHKTDSSYAKDIGKAIWWLVRALMNSGVKTIELPVGSEQVIHIPEK